MNEESRTSIRLAMLDLKSQQEKEMLYLHQLAKQMPIDPNSVDASVKKRIDELLIKHSKKEITE